MLRLLKLSFKLFRFDPLMLSFRLFRLEPFKLSFRLFLFDPFKLSFRLFLLCRLPCIVTNYLSLTRWYRIIKDTFAQLFHIVYNSLTIIAIYFKRTWIFGMFSLWLEDLEGLCCWFSWPCGSCRAVCLMTYLSSLLKFSLDVETSVSLPLKLWGRPPVEKKYISFSVFLRTAINVHCKFYSLLLSLPPLWKPQHKDTPCIDSCFLCRLLVGNGRNLFPCCSELIFVKFSSFDVDYSVRPSKEHTRKKKRDTFQKEIRRKKKKRKKCDDPDIAFADLPLQIWFYSGRPFDGSPGESYK